MSFEYLQSALERRRVEQLFRRRFVVEEQHDCMLKVDGKYYLNFSSNDYLGMRQSGDVLQAWVNGLAKYGGGSGASPVVTGHTQAHQALESYLAEALGRERVLLFNSGFAANQALLHALFSQLPDGQQGHIIADKLSHASLIDGARSANANFARYRHNDIEHLEQRLQGKTGHTLVVTEGVFSMDGDCAPLKAIVPVVAKHNAHLMLDDAHGFGVLGDTGMGSVEALELGQQELPIVMATFGKAIGTSGAFIAGSEHLIDYLVNFARHYIYSTAMPPAQTVATLASIQALRKTDKREQLQENISEFKRLAKSAGLSLLPSDTAIQPLLLSSPEHALAISDELKVLGLWVSAIRYPTVAKGTERLRITLSAMHQSQDLLSLVDGLQICLQKYKATS